jgi:predicted Zn-dependent protease
MRIVRAFFAARSLLFACGIVLSCLGLISCSLYANIPVVADEHLDSLVRTEAARIIAATEDVENLPRYRVFLSDFPRADILGMSIGQRRIYISYKLARLASYRSRDLWLLRQTLAHEIAHEISGHAKRSEWTFNNFTAGRGITSSDVGLPWTVRFQNYSAEKELQADLEGMKYWAKLNWDCGIWVRILNNFHRQNYSGGLYHPTDQRLEQASRVCPNEPAKAPLRASLTPFVQ